VPTLLKVTVAGRSAMSMVAMVMSNIRVEGIKETGLIGPTNTMAYILHKPIQ
jgi:hypothetical protein